MSCMFTPQSGAHRFGDLLKKLHEEHERQVQELQDQVSSLQKQLSRLGPRDGVGAEDDVRPGRAAEKQGSHCPVPPLDLHAIPVIVPDGEDSTRLQTASTEVLELKGVWKELIRQHMTTDLECLTDTMANTQAMQTEADQPEEDGKERIGYSCCLKCLRTGSLSPNSSWRFHWECTGLILVCFDLINIPFSSVYEPPPTFFSVTMDWTTLLFWTGDLMQAFFVGFYRDGYLVLTQPAIVKQYLKGWFLIDCIVVVPDWFLTVLGSESQAGELSRLLRGSRAIRVLRLLRVIKLQRVINKIYDMIDNEYSFIVAELVKLMMVILTLNHVIACGWFLTGKLSMGDGNPSWVTWTEKFLEMDIGYQYATSLHWTLTQFTPASMDVVARNLQERLYSIVVLLFAMVAFSSIVGTVTSSMTVIRQMKNDKQKQFWMLRRYLKQKNVSMDLTTRMTRFLEHSCQKQQRLIQASKVTLLTQLSDQLARELAFEMFEPCLRNHAFFRFLCKDMKFVAQRICKMALKAMQVAIDDTIFSLGEEASKAFIIKSGELGYTQQNGCLLMPPPALKECVAEAAIWTPWRYRGRLFALQPSDLLVVEAGRFAEAMSIHPKPVSIAMSYGRKFINLLNSQPSTEWTDVLRDVDFYGAAAFDVGTTAGEDALLSECEEPNCANGRESEDEVAGVHTDRAETRAKEAREDEHTARPRSSASGASASRGVGVFVSACFPALLPARVCAGDRP
uniref:Ion transport domain-containing protein n=1 Tax=Alexandrium monilatum TaxID=311494 RepID=A0A7S4SR31_9DINO